MTYTINETHDPNLRSWVESANDPNTDFPIQNLPFCVFRHKGGIDSRLGIGIGNYVLDVTYVNLPTFLKDSLPYFVTAGNMENSLMKLDRKTLSAFRKRLSELLRADNFEIRNVEGLVERILVPQDKVELQLPVSIGNYTDFYASVYHATNIGKMFRPDQPLMPNYKWVPIGYHGRASSIVVSGTPIRRPVGQTKDDNAEAPAFGPSKVLDYELEVGFFVGDGNEQGKPINIAEAEDRIFGLCLVNDWSARDIQRWEYQPLGPGL